MTNTSVWLFYFFFFQAEDGIRDLTVTGVQTCALPISRRVREDADPYPPGRRARQVPAGAPRKPGGREWLLGAVRAGTGATGHAGGTGAATDPRPAGGELRAPPIGAHARLVPGARRRGGLAG